MAPHPRWLLLLSIILISLFVVCVNHKFTAGIVITVILWLLLQFPVLRCGKRCMYELIVMQLSAVFIIVSNFTDYDFPIFVLLLFFGLNFLVCFVNIKDERTPKKRLRQSYS